MKHIKKWLIPILVIAGLGLIAYPYIMDNFISPKKLDKGHEEAMELVNADEMRDNLDRLRGNEDGFNFDEVELLGDTDVDPYINKENVIGGIYIPSVQVNMPIMYGATNENLRSAVGTMKPEQVMGEGNYSIAGHNAKNPNILFAPIRRIEQGDKMYITDKDKVYVYEKVRDEVVKPNRIDVIDDVEGETLLTLVSCFSADGSDRIIVTGELVEVLDIGDAPKDVQKVFGQG